MLENFDEIIPFEQHSKEWQKQSLVNTLTGRYSDNHNFMVGGQTPDDVVFKYDEQNNTFSNYYWYDKDYDNFDPLTNFNSGYDNHGANIIEQVLFQLSNDNDEVDVIWLHLDACTRKSLSVRLISSFDLDLSKYECYEDFLTYRKIAIRSAKATIDTTDRYNYAWNHPDKVSPEFLEEAINADDPRKEELEEYKRLGEF